MKYLNTYNESKSLENDQEINNIFNIARDEGLTVELKGNSFSYAKIEEYYNISRYLNGVEIATKDKLIEVCQEMLERMKNLEYDVKVRVVANNEASNLVSVLFYIN